MGRDFGPGRLTAAWLDERAEENPWVLETTAPFDEGHRDAFLGNGFIGQRIGIEGDVAAFSTAEGNGIAPGGCFVHGLWDETGLMPPPRWATLGYEDGLETFRRGAGEWRNYRQRLNMRTGVLETEVDWENRGRETRIQTAVYPSRARQNVGVLSRTVTPGFDGVVSVTDELDGEFIDDASDWRFTTDERPEGILSMQLTMGPRRRRVAVVSRLVLEGVKTPVIVCSKTERGVARRVTFQVEAGKSYTVTKVVALVTDGEAPGPWLHARTLAEAAAGDLDAVRRENDAEWEALWAHGIEVSQPRLQKLLNATLYQLYCNLRPGGKWSPGPTGLSANHWRGHIFWDSDLWMFPGICLLNPELARGFVAYRAGTLEGARRNARAEGHAGAMFAWESAEFGDETIPQLIFHHQHHVNSDVAMAAWWFSKVAGSKGDGLSAEIERIIVGSAEFWASWAVYNPEQDRYEIRRVCCVDEHAGIQDNNASTNWGAVRTLQLAMGILEKTGRSAPEKWAEIVSKMWVPFDAKNGRYLEYEGYSGQQIKQADAVLLIYPYEMPMPAKVKAATVDYYRTKYPDANIMMAAAMDGIVDCELGRAESGWESLLKCAPHFRMPFLLPTESPSNEVASFATGLGGLLQLVLAGFCGIRIRADGLRIQPCLPKALEWVRVKGLHYDGVCFNVEVGNAGVTVSDPDAEIDFRIENAEGQSWL